MRRHLEARDQLLILVHVVEALDCDCHPPPLRLADCPARALAQELLVMRALETMHD